MHNAFCKSAALGRGPALLTAAAVAILCALGGSVMADAIDDTKAAVGFTALQTRLGAAIPTGAGIAVAQVEFGPTAFLPTTTQAELVGKNYIVQTPGGTTSSHATTVARLFYGTRSLAPGIPTVNLYEAENWLGAGLLRTQTPDAPLAAQGRVINNSWVLTYDTDPGNNAAEEAAAIDASRRLDYLIARDKVVAVAGVNNGAGTPVPLLLASSYNSIAVGLSTGQSSTGGTTLDVPGRPKPDLVARGEFPGASGPSVSRATATVSSAAALLLQTAGANLPAQQPETIKAVLLSGATKEEFDLTHSTTTTLDDWSRSTTRPLDLRYGAGELNIDNSHRILTAGQQTPGGSHLAANSGWNLAATGPSPQTYFFRVPQGATANTFSVTAAWNRQIAFQPGTAGANATLTPTLANADVRLYSAAVAADHQSFVVQPGPLDSSLSTIDNVEHIYQRNLAPGLYAMEVVSNQTADVAVAWDARFTAPQRKVSVASLNNSQIVNFSGPHGETPFAGPASGVFSPLGMTYDATGNLYVADVLTNRVLRYDPLGQASVVADASSGAISPAGLAFDSTGDLFVVNYLTNSIVRIAPGGEVSTFADASDGLAGPFGIAVDSLNNVYVASLDNQRVLKFNPSGVGSVVADSSDGLFTPLALAVDAAGDVYIADTLANRIHRLDALGQLSTFADGSDGVSGPTGLAFDPDGDLFVANYLANTITRLDPLGNGVVYADSSDGLDGPWGLAVAPLPATLALGRGGLSSLDAGDLAGAGQRFAAVPEPSSAALLAAGTMALFVLRARRRR